MTSCKSKLWGRGLIPWKCFARLLCGVVDKETQKPAGSPNEALAAVAIPAAAAPGESPAIVSDDSMTELAKAVKEIATAVKGIATAMGVADVEKTVAADKPGAIAGGG